MGRLQDKIAVITGICGGMGREAARRFAALIWRLRTASRRPYLVSLRRSAALIW